MNWYYLVIEAPLIQKKVSKLFTNKAVNKELLKVRAYNLRWATVPKGIIPLTSADMDFPCAPEISEAISRFTKDRYFCYGNNEGMSSFKEAMANYFQKKRNIPANPAYILPVDSAAFGIYTTCKAFLFKNEEAIIFDPVDFLFQYSVTSVGGVAIPFKLKPSDETLDFDRLENIITEKTKMLCLCNPLNPTGKIFTKKELLHLGNIAVKYNLVILSDEIWSDIVYSPHTFTSIASLNESIRNRTITITGFSKSFGLSGLRIGVIMASNFEKFNKILNASLHQSTIHGSNIISQVAATAALNDCAYWLEEFVLHLHSMRSLVVDELNTINGVTCILPEGSFLAFPNISGTNKSSTEIQKLLLDTAKVAVVPEISKWFGEGAEGHIRISFASSDEILREALYRIKKTIRAL